MVAMNKKWILLILFFISIKSFSQSDELSLYYKKGCNLLFNKNEYDSAIIYFNKTIECLNEEVNGYSQPSANARSLIAQAYYDKQQYDLAIKYGEEVLSICKIISGEETTDYATSLHNMLMYHYSAKQYENGISYGEQALEITEELLGKQNNLCYSILEKLAGCYSGINKYTTAGKYGYDALVIAKNGFGEESSEYAAALNNYAFYIYKQGYYSESIVYYKKCLDIRGKILGKEHKHYKNTINNLRNTCFLLGENLFDNGKYSDALYAYSELDDYLTDLDDDDYADIYKKKSMSYWRMGLYDKAIECGMTAVGSIGSNYGTNSIEYAESLIHLIDVFKEISDYGMALTLGNEVLEIYEKNNIKNKLIYANMASLYNVIGYIKLSDKMYNKAIAIVKQEDDMRSYSSLMGNMAISLGNRGNYRKAIKYSKKALEYKSKIFNKDHEEYIITLLNHAHLYERIGRNIKACKLYETYYEIESDKLTQTYPIMPKKIKESYMGMNYNNIIQMLALHPQRAKNRINKVIYNYLLLSKYMLQYSETTLKKAIYNSNDSINIFTYEFLRTECDDCYNLEKLLLDNMKSEYNFNISDINKTYIDVNENMADDDIAIEFIGTGIYDDFKKKIIRGDYFCLLTKKSYKTPVLIRLNKCNILDSLQKNKHKIYNNGLLYECVWKPIEPYLKEGDNVYFSPDGILHLLNIEDAVDNNGILFSDKYNVHRITSTANICKANELVEYKNIALFGGLQYKYNTTEKSIPEDIIEYFYQRYGFNYLPSTLNEVNEISHLMSDNDINTYTYTDFDGTEDSFKNLSGKNMSIIHIATHGFFYNINDISDIGFYTNYFENQKDTCDNKPDILSLFYNNYDSIATHSYSMSRSGLIMSGGENAWINDSGDSFTEDGILLSSEISALNLTETDLIVLSACETALGDVTIDGVLGLQRAFKNAGVNTIVMSLWKVDDEATSYFMINFYKILLNGASKREAFDTAKRLTRDKYEDPYYWAAFIMLD